MVDESMPFVSIIMPIRNEADFIGRAIRSILDNDYPIDRIEVLVVDGMSADGTRDTVQQLCEQDNRVSLYDNKRKVVPSALNIGIRNSKGQILIPVSGHAEVANDFIKQSVQQLQKNPEVWCVGGPVETVSTTYIGKAIATALTSPVGIGNAMWRLGNYEGYVDTLAFGAYWRWVFENIGIFDEQLVRNQDDELNLRLILHGGKIFITPKIKSRYYARSNMRKLWRQYFQYGFWRIKTLQKHRRPATIRQVIPLLFVLSLMILSLTGFLLKFFWWVLLAEVAFYVLGLAIGSIDVGRKAGWKYALLAPLVFIILHLAYGLGGLWGIVRFVLLQGMGMPKPSQIKMSR
ncbi:MAG: glycosyltransferase family 2 protein [Sedimentisphaerales bacterium]